MSIITSMGRSVRESLNMRIVLERLEMVEPLDGYLPHRVKEFIRSAVKTLGAHLRIQSGASFAFLAIPVFAKKSRCC